jgi:hypothetical protein
MDLEIIETNNGGDLVKNPKDLSMTFGFDNMVYLAMFGGNREASTPLLRDENAQAFDFWANSLLFANDSSIQMNSETERTLDKVALNSFGRTLIEKAVKKDLEFMDAFAVVSVAVSIVSVDTIAIAIKVVRLDNLEQRAFVYVWDATNSRLIQRQAVINKGGQTVTTRIFDETFDFSFE